MAEKISSSNNDEPKVHLDTILVEELGQFGWYQLRTMALVLVVGTFSAWTSNEYVFTAARINTRCQIPECESAESQFTQPWLPDAIPTTSTGSLVSCQRYLAVPSTTTTTGGSTSNNTCPRVTFDHDTVTPCDRRVYENTDTIVYDFDLGCDEWRRTFVGSLRIAGIMLSLGLTGYMSDRWGRRFTLTICAVNSAWLGLVRYWATSYTSYVLVAVLETIFGTPFTSSYILVTELVGPQYRVIAGAFVCTFFSIGQLTLPLIAWSVGNWRNLILALYIPQFVTVIYFWTLPESVRWCLSKGRYHEAEKVLTDVARLNKRHLSEKSLQALRDVTKDENQSKKMANTSEPWVISVVFRHKRVLLRCAIVPLWWITTIFVFYGLLVNSASLSGNRFLNYVCVASGEIPGFWSAVLLLNAVGRKPLIITAFILCGVAQVTYIFLPAGHATLSLVLFVASKYCVSAVTMTMYVYTAELFPTQCRHRLFAFCSMLGRLGAVLAPLTPALAAAIWESLPYAMFGALSLSSALLALLVPETRGESLPDTMQEADALGSCHKRPQNTKSY